jgi:xanthine/CO dehydrogenase XdhC/CoxF family maturation factor
MKAMSELTNILAAFDSLCPENKSAALATVIAIEGSAYRRPGARLLIAEDGRTWGTISGGCLEKDVARRGRLVIASSKSVFATYDSRDEDDLSPRTATGCGGAVKIFIQPVSSAHPGPMPFFRQCFDQHQPMLLATTLHAEPDSPRTIGDCFIPEFPSSPPAAQITRLRDNSSSMEIFLEQIAPPPRLLLFGNGPEVAPMQTMAALLGWKVHHISLRSLDDPSAISEIHPEDAVVIMTRNIHQDARILADLPANLRYLGILGPRHRTRRLLAAAPQYEDCYSPAGLNIGAETPQEIALAIVAEIQAVLRHRDGQSLRDLDGPIHLAAPNAKPNWRLASLTSSLQPCPQ